MITLSMPALEDISILNFSSDHEDGDEEADMSNLDTKIQVFQNKKDERGIMIRNKSRLVAEGHTEEEGIDYDKAFAQLPELKQLGFEDLDFPDKVYKVEKALYGLHQAFRAWYETLLTYLLENRFHRGKIDKTLFIRRHKDYILLVQVYVDDIIFEVKKVSTPKETQKPLIKNEDGEEVDVYMYRSMIGSLIKPRVDPTLLNDFEMATNGNGDSIPPAGGATNFGLKNDMIQQVQNSCQFHRLSGDDANKHLDKFLHVTQSIKVNGVTDDALCLYLFPHSLTHLATAWFDRSPRNSITTFEQMAKMFLRKYFPPSMVTKLRNEITNFRQRGTFMKRRPEECYDLIKNMTAHHNDWILPFKGINQQVKAVTHNCETCGGPHSYNDCPATVGQIQNVYAVEAYNQGGNSYQPQGSNHGIPHGNNQERNQFLQGASHGQNPLPAYQAPAYQALSYQAPVHQALIPQP
nr:reverse transcriptase domain-containing protein [Tanacetum cinerariifolium]